MEKKCLKLVHGSLCLVSTIDTDGLVLQFQGISGKIDEYAPMRCSFLWVNIYFSLQPGAVLRLS